jgi:hypothetical protein
LVCTVALSINLIALFALFAENSALVGRVDVCALGNYPPMCLVNPFNRSGTVMSMNFNQFIG